MPQNPNEDDKPRTGNEKPHFLKNFFDEKTALDNKAWLIDKYIYQPALLFLTKLHIPATIARPIAITLTLIVFVTLVYLVLFALLALFVFISHIF